MIERHLVLKAKKHAAGRFEIRGRPSENLSLKGTNTKGHSLLSVQQRSLQYTKKGWCEGWERIINTSQKEHRHGFVTRDGLAPAEVNKNVASKTAGSLLETNKKDNSKRLVLTGMPRLAGYVRRSRSARSSSPIATQCVRWAEASSCRHVAC